MPIVTGDSQPTRRRAPWWVLGPVVVALLIPVGLVAWSFFSPVVIPLGDRTLALGTSPAILATGVVPLDPSPATWAQFVYLPDGKPYLIALFAETSQ